MFYRLIWLCFVLFSGQTHAVLHYQLHIQVNPEQQMLSGNAILHADEAKTVQLSLKGLTDVVVNQQKVNVETVILPLSLQAKTPVKIQFKRIIQRNNPNNIITPKDIFLFENWYPQPQQVAHYQFSATLPTGFVAQASADTIQQTGQTWSFDFPYPQQNLHLTASTEYVRRQRQFQGILLETYFLNQDTDLADEYLTAIEQYITYYQQQLTPFPYKRFAVVANRFPSGWAMPSVTLLGQRMLRLPFMLQTSLGHEILHQWFGLMLRKNKGNWSEGLVNYLADHQFARNKGEGVAYRKQILSDYQDYVHQPQALQDFRYRDNKTAQVIGYGKGAMLFHAVRQRIGDAAFFQTLQQVLQQQAFSAFSWSGWQQAFSQQAKIDCQPLFEQFLTREDIADFSVHEAKLAVRQGQLFLDFQVQQHTSQAYDLIVPVQISADETQTFHLQEKIQHVSLKLKNTPETVRIDPEYHLMRQLSPSENLSNFAQLFGADKSLIIASDTAQADYANLLILFPQAERVTPEKVTFSDWSAHNLILVGSEHPWLKRDFPHLSVPKKGLLATVLRHPYARDKNVLWLLAHTPKNHADFKRRLSHYGRYQQLYLHENGQLEKILASSDNGLLLYQHPNTTAIATAQTLNNLDDLLPEIVQKRLIFVGEQHDQFAHHWNQLRVMQALHATGKAFAVGLEMFRQPTQAVLDAYVAGEINEAVFLKQSHYFRDWAFDYNLYKPLLDFARLHHIPLIALNLPHALSKQVAMDGLQSVSTTQQAFLPDSFDLQQPHYQTDLLTVFKQHQHEDTPFSQQDFNHFMQAQLIWDEGMAARAALFLQQNPQHTLLVLAGNGHIRHEYGIPQRLQRRFKVEMITLLQDEDLTEGIADYVLLPTPLDGLQAPRLGVFLSPTGLVVQKVMSDSIAEQAGIQAEDVLQGLDNITVNTLADLKYALFQQSIDTKVTLDVLRKAKKLQLTVQF